MIAGCGSQLRLATIPTPDGFITRPVGLDYTAVMMLGAAAGADLRLIGSILPRIEAAIINPATDEPEETDHGDA